MASNDCEDDTAVTAEGAEVQLVENFWYTWAAALSRLLKIFIHQRMVETI